ncbi:methenyltetrahydrofolate synthase domain-containing protein isoform X1 [Chiloscyllium plagiosum]|uniref:methenyltetrahydrofolate synthase domain-containing protein isoform X1 n=1 Tax=Chiloscyllium plagiosum TaxID=36176 RepID=UPI001CB82AE7|nr:methenyltetrahydrofolate synthase domain-containing protein isoform X1 [Chiloscyllium plagiosum]
MEPAIKLKPGVSKWDIRQKVWDYMEENNLANFPRPVHHRIPNFKGAYDACNRIKTLDSFMKTREVKVDPDKPLEGVRLATLQARKTLLVPTPRLRTGLFNKIIPPPGASKEIVRVCSTAQGVKDFSVPIGLDANIHVDLVVVGSVAVSEKGWRIGKGEGFADLEYAMMVSMGAVDENTVVVTTVHDCQLLDIPEELMDSHDLTVDYILTPSQVIKTNCSCSKPQGIIWSKVDSNMMEKIPILKSLQFRERKAGKDVALKEERHAEKKELQRLLEKRISSGKGGGATKVKTNAMEMARNTEASEEHKEPSCKNQPNAPTRVTSIYMGNLPHSLRVSELKNTLREHNAVPLRLSWQGAQHRAFLDYKDEVTAEEAVTSLTGLSISGSVIRVELAKSQRGNRSKIQTTEKPSSQ